MAPSQCRKCGRMVHWGARTCQYCGCESPAATGPVGPRKALRKKGEDTSGFSPSLLSGWWWIVVFLVIASAVIAVSLLKWSGVGRVFPIDPGSWK